MGCQLAKSSKEKKKMIILQEGSNKTQAIEQFR
jgi:hypothetical protein